MLFFPETEKIYLEPKKCFFDILYFCYGNGKYSLGMNTLPDYIKRISKDYTLDDEFLSYNDSSLKLCLDDLQVEKYCDEAYQKILKLQIPAEEMYALSVNFLQSVPYEYSQMQYDFDTVLLELLQSDNDNNLIYSYFHPQFLSMLNATGKEYELILPNEDWYHQIIEVCNVSKVRAPSAYSSLFL